MRLRHLALAIALLLAASPVFAARRVVLVPGDQLPRFELQDREGRSWRSESLHAERPLVLSFFATNCAPCKKELPLLQKIHAERGGEIRIVVVVLDPEGLKVFAPYREEHGITFTVLDGSGGAIQDLLGIDALPRVFLVGKGGMIRESLLGFEPAKAAEFEGKILGLADETRKRPTPQDSVPNPRPFPPR